ncbi:MAG: tail fiber domain-containing protein, partial [Vicinamibacterales bacterium]
GDSDRHIGFIAQDVEDVIPDAVRRQRWGGDLLTLDDRAILAALVNAVQELQRRVR